MGLQNFAIPSECATKQLKIKTTKSGRRIVISSNLLCLFNFHPQDRATETSLGEGKGMVIERMKDLFSTVKTKLVYSREYTRRKNNPIETLLQVASQKIIDESFPIDCKFVHIEMQQDRVFIRPLSTFKAQALKNATLRSKNTVAVACSSGVDISQCLEPVGWKTNILIEHRPVERRDAKRKSDLTEVGAIAALRNIKNGIKHLFCEDITTIGTRQIEKAVSKDPAMLFLASVQCDEFSQIKANSLKDSAINDLSSSMDMMLDIYRLVLSVKSPVIAFENVRGWYKSELYQCLSLRLRKMGYQENLLISDARDQGGVTSRVRGYAVFSCLDVPFYFQPKQERRANPIWPMVEKYLPDCRDVTNNKSMQDGLSTGRLRLITTEKTFCPTILKSQSRSAKDSCVIQFKDRLYWPTEDLLKELMGMPEIELDCVSADIASEIIGQSVDVPAFSSIIKSINEHIELYFNNRMTTSFS